MPQSDLEAAPNAMPVRILVVEDEALIRLSIAEALRDLGINVVEAATADEAWDFLTTGAPVDLVFTDHKMPGSMTGAELAAKIRQDYPHLPIVITSAHFAASGWSVLRKPYPLFETANDLAELAQKSRGKGTSL